MGSLEQAEKDLALAKRHFELKLQEVKRLKRRDAAIEACESLVDQLQRDEESPQAEINELKTALVELSDCFSKTQDGKVVERRSIKGFLRLKEGRSLLKILQNLPVEVYIKLDSVVELPHRPGMPDMSAESEKKGEVNTEPVEAQGTEANEEQDDEGWMASIYTWALARLPFKDHQKEPPSSSK